MPITPPGQTRNRVFRYVEKRLRAGDSPSLREIRDYFGFRAVETVRSHLSALVEEGRLLKQPGRARGYRLPAPVAPDTPVAPVAPVAPDALPSGAPAPGHPLPPPPDYRFDDNRPDAPEAFPDPEQAELPWRRRTLQPVPLLGEVAAGGFEEAVENPDGNLLVEIPDSRDPSDYFALRVRGESMTGAGILEGDLVIVERRTEAVSGQIVVALVEDEATVKRLHLDRDRLELRPENPAFETLRPPPEDCRILGRVVEVRRRLH